ncbi:hypothetical protein D4764_0186610, partial [Takifugu flavidus]
EPLSAALQKLRPRRQQAPGPARWRVAMPGPSVGAELLILYGAQAVPIRLRILLDACSAS